MIMTAAPYLPSPSGEQPTSVEPLSASPAPREQWQSADLFGDRKEILIVHNNEIYRLRRTRHDKLILHK